jgi:hypothetical protein
MVVVENPNQPPGMPLYRGILGFAASVLTVGMFATGYLATTAVARMLISTRVLWIYPVVAAVLYSIHLEIMFVAMRGTGWTRGEQLVVRMGGAAVVFVCALGCSVLLRRWTLPVALTGDATRARA